MGANTKIEWTHTPRPDGTMAPGYSFNPWVGCQRVSPGCQHCYAEAMNKRTGGGNWGPGAPRRVTSESYWRQPLKWNREAEAAGERRKVFCASMADVFDADAPVGALERLWGLIRQTPNLDWLLLTKRPERIADSLPSDWGDGYPNVWLGATAEDQEMADKRIPILLSVPAVVRFLSLEPLLGPVGLTALRVSERCQGCSEMPRADALEGLEYCGCTVEGGEPLDWGSIDWLIVGAESGPNRRPFEITWLREIAETCISAGVPVFVKQGSAAGPGQQGRIPDDMWALKQFPTPREAVQKETTP